MPPPLTLPQLSECASGGRAGQPTPAFSPLYQQIKGLILQSLQAGEWKPGEAIPSEMDLAARFRVSQGTVRKAIDELAAENLLVRRQGKGTFVATHAEQHVQYRFLKLMPDDGDARQRRPGPAPDHGLQAPARQRRGRPRAGLRTGDAVLQVRRVLSFAGVPTILEDLWLPGGPFKGLTAEQLAIYRARCMPCSNRIRRAHGARRRKKSAPCCPTIQAEWLLKVPKAPRC
jgi:GntR family transcriptional regulator